MIENPTAAQWLTIAVFAALPSVGMIAGPSYAFLVFGWGIAQAALGVSQRRWPPIDLQLAAIAAGFAGLCWASVVWSIDPARSALAALGTTAVLAGALLALASPIPAPLTANRLFGAMVVAVAVGCVILLVDTALDYRLQELLLHKPAPMVGTKYNRGMDHLSLIVWPVLGFVAYRRGWKGRLLIGLPLLGAVAVTMSLAAKVAVIIGFAALLSALWLPRLIAPALGIGTLIIAVGTPFGLHLLAEQRAALAPYLKISGFHRLEIWDHVTTHLFQRPLLGWGIASSSELPMPPQELSHYVILNGTNIYAHDQWLQLWVETGALGAIVGLAFVLLLLRRIQRLNISVRPFAYAAFAAGVLISCVNFEVMTDSWWAAVTACAFLLVTLDHAVIPAERA